MNLISIKHIVKVGDMYVCDYECDNYKPYSITLTNDRDLAFKFSDDRLYKEMAKVTNGELYSLKTYEQYALVEDW